MLADKNLAGRSGICTNKKPAFLRALWTSLDVAGSVFGGLDSIEKHSYLYVFNNDKPIKK